MCKTVFREYIEMGRGEALLGHLNDLPLFGVIFGPSKLKTTHLKAKLKNFVKIVNLIN